MPGPEPGQHWSHYLNKPTCTHTHTRTCLITVIIITSESETLLINEVRPSLNKLPVKRTCHEFTSENSQCPPITLFASSIAPH